MITVKVTVGEAKKGLYDYVKDMYGDIINDFWLDVNRFAEEKNTYAVIDHTKTIRSYEQDRDELLEKINASQSLYDLLRVINEMLDENRYPFCEQEQIIFETVFRCQVVEDDIVQLERPQEVNADHE